MSASNSTPVSPKFKDMTGLIFSRLTVIDCAGRNKRKQATWNCQCDCGALIVVDGNSLRSGKTKSCGCLQKQICSVVNAKHGFTRVHKRHPLHAVWSAMKQRCNNPNNYAYKNYGGRGITVCKRWMDSFECFISDMGECPEKMTLDRIDNEGQYSPENCRWTDRSTQSRNQRRSIERMIEFNGEKLRLNDWARRYNHNPGLLHHRIYTSKWPLEKALLTPSKGYQKWQ